MIMSKGTILLVDDEQTLLESVRYDLEKEGYQVAIAENGETGIEKLRSGCYQVVVTDLKLEGLDGIQVLKEAKTLHPDSMVVILTGFGALDSAIDALRMGASDYLLKPCKREELLQRIGNCFERIELKKKIRLYEKILPVCCVCKKIRDDRGKEPGTGEWIGFEEFLVHHSSLDLSHGYCEDCFRETKEKKKR